MIYLHRKASCHDGDDCDSDASAHDDDGELVSSFCVLLPLLPRASCASLCDDAYHDGGDAYHGGDACVPPCAYASSSDEVRA